MTKAFLPSINIRRLPFASPVRRLSPLQSLMKVGALANARIRDDDDCDNSVISAKAEESTDYRELRGEEQTQLAPLGW